MGNNQLEPQNQLMAFIVSFLLTKFDSSRNFDSHILLKSVFTLVNIRWKISQRTQRNATFCTQSVATHAVTPWLLFPSSLANFICVGGRLLKFRAMFINGGWNISSSKVYGICMDRLWILAWFQNKMCEVPLAIFFQMKRSKCALHDVRKDIFGIVAFQS